MGYGILPWVGFAICLLLGFLLSGMEAGVFALSRLRVRQLTREGKPSARALHSYLENPENFLWTILVGNTVVNFLVLGWLVVVLRNALHGRLWLFVSVFSCSVFLFYVFFDLLPKMLFRTYPNRLCLGMARPFGAIYIGLRPLVALVESASAMFLKMRGGTAFKGHVFGNRDELRFVMQENSQALSSEERVMINRVLDLQNLTASHAMVPMDKVTSLDKNARVADALEITRLKGITRLPVLETSGKQRRVIGVLSVNTILYQQDVDLSRPVSEFLRPALFIEEGVRLEVALRRMQKAGERIAIILGRDHKEAGILTLQDVLRSTFGEVSL
jgi:CBS domain containing-hemolysin-like protein